MSANFNKDPGYNDYRRPTDTYIDKQTYDSGLSKRVGADELVIGCQYFTRFANTDPNGEPVEYTEYSVVIVDLIYENGDRRVFYKFTFHSEQQEAAIDATGLMGGGCEFEGGITTKEGYFVRGEDWDDGLARLQEELVLETI